MSNMLFDFDDLLIQPITLSDISSRKEINCRYADSLPIMTAPMDTVICESNKYEFINNGIMPVLPRIANPQLNHVHANYFLSYSMEDFKRIFLDNTPPNIFDKPLKVLIDVANGHMRELLDLAKSGKKKYGSNIFLMVGNIANPDTFNEYCNIVDAVRIGIGNGNGCLTTVQTGVGYPMASLIKECKKVTSFYVNSGRPPLIVADGGFKKYSDIIKALALGADYVMLGSILNKALESCGETTREDGEVVNQFSTNAYKMFEADIPLYKTFRGMSTKEVQKAWGKEVLTTSEGIVKRQQVEYTIKGWVENFESYLKSAMSYTGKKELHQFIGGVHYNLITQNSFKRFDK